MTSPLPSRQYLVAFNNGPFDDPALISTVASPGTLGAHNVWSDITQWVSKHDIKRGRQHELDQFEAGTLTVDLDNEAGTFNPWNTASPFAGLIKPMVPAQVRVGWGGTTWPRYTGFATGWPILWPDPMSSQAQLVCSDSFRLFNTATLDTAGLVQQLSGARINALLDRMGWSSGARSIDAGSTLIQADAQALVKTSALGVLQDTEGTEAGGLFMDGAGRVRFVARGALAYDPLNPTSPYAISQATIGDEPSVGELPFQPGPTLGIDDIDIYNQAVVTRFGGTEQVYDDLVSQAAYGIHTWKPNGTMLYTSDADALNRGLYVVSKHAQPVTRLASITVDLIDLIEPDLVAQLLALDLMYRVTVNRHGPPGGGDPFTQAGNIESISEVVDADSWSFTFALAPGENTGFWIWDSSAWDDTTRWG